MTEKGLSIIGLEREQLCQNEYQTDMLKNLMGEAMKKLQWEELLKMAGA